jgi:PAS domain S-box-containing protein
MKSSKKKSEKKAPSAELLYRVIFNQSPDGILIIDTDGKMIDFNEASHRQLGYTREEFAGLSLRDVDPHQTPEEIGASIAEVLTKGEADFEVKHITKNGEIRDVQVITKAIDLSGRIGFLTIWRDITERKRDEEALRIHRHHLEDLVEERSAELKQLNEELQNDITQRITIEQEREKLITELREALAKIKILSGLLPMCAWCKKIRDDNGYWKKVETYIREHTDATFTHGICPDCLKKVDPETYRLDFETKGGHRSFPERRLDARLKHIPVEDYSIVAINIRDWRKSVLDASIDDLSEGGMCIRTDSPVDDNSLVLLDHGGMTKTGIVIWKKNADLQNGMHRTGIKFIKSEASETPED